ncbi:hypothetical protein QYE76_029540 [Lolium multiflorum]|uniref:Aminotransferase-like plant mobile domain-containing protein n=1 Tax=Lolium multiflorum TaxID=4521 RepID=A0AAD8VFM1_LOLMU|nr:hypothetical protein QYE76_029540 [Lolium multiflorum]
MGRMALTALVGRWRPETHTFHLRAGEMTTLQDVSMILGLPIQGEPLCMNTTSDGWRGQMDDLIGRAPPPPADPKERTPAGAPFAWIRTRFGTCPEGVERDTIRTYTRVYLWYMISRTLFADSGGKLANWCWLRTLTVLEHPWSWGTAALAYLYRQKVTPGEFPLSNNQDPTQIITAVTRCSGGDGGVDGGDDDDDDDDGDDVRLDDDGDGVDFPLREGISPADSCPPESSFLSGVLRPAEAAVTLREVPSVA